MYLDLSANYKGENKCKITVDLKKQYSKGTHLYLYVCMVLLSQFWDLIYERIVYSYFALLCWKTWQ